MGRGLGATKSRARGGARGRLLEWRPMRRAFRWTLLAALLLLAAAIAAWKISEARSFQAFGELVHRVETDKPLVALTFDDGPTPAGAQAVLALLEQEGVRATFFFTGAELA